MIYTLIGNNTHERDKMIRGIVTDFTAEHGNLGVERFDADETEAQLIIDAMQNTSLFAENKLVIVRNFSANKQFMEQLEQLISSMSDSTDVILTDNKLDKRSGQYKQLKKHTQLHEFTEKKPMDIVGWAVEYAGKQEAKLTSNDARYLIEMVGPNQAIVASEIDKLALFDSNISRTNIDLLCEPTPQSSVFQLIDAAFAGNNKRLMALYDEQRAQKVEPHAILGMIAWQLHILALIKSAQKAGVSDIASQAKLSPFVVQKSQSITRKLTLAQVKDLIASAHKLDIRLKSQPIDSDDAMKLFLITKLGAI